VLKSLAHTVCKEFIKNEHFKKLLILMSFLHNGERYAGRQKSTSEISIGMKDDSMPFSTGEVITMVVLDRSRDFEILDYKRARTGNVMRGLKSIISLTVRPLDVKEKQQQG